MKASVEINGHIYDADLRDPIDISITLVDGQTGPKCFYAPDFDIKPVRSDGWVGSTQEGGIVNFKNVNINPHGNGTHTECVGHISTEIVNINKVLTQSHFIAQVVTIAPEAQDNGDLVITNSQIKELTLIDGVEGLVIRTLPNGQEKKSRDYSGTNPPYVQTEAIYSIVEEGIKHFLLDLPSVDREEDEGKLSGHRAFWNYPAQIDTNRTITELIFVNKSVVDGLYLCDLQIINIAMDASPSRPLLYKLIKRELRSS